MARAVTKTFLAMLVFASCASHAGIGKWWEKEVVGAVTGERPPRIHFDQVSINHNGDKVMALGDDSLFLQVGDVTIKTHQLKKRLVQAGCIIVTEGNVAKCAPDILAREAGKIANGATIDQKNNLGSRSSEAIGYLLQEQSNASSDGISVDAPDNVVNGAKVSVSVRVKSASSPGKILVYIDSNEQLFAGGVSYFSTMNEYSFSTRLKVNGTGTIYAFFVPDNGPTLAARKKVEIQQAGTVEQDCNQACQTAGNDFNFVSKDDQTKIILTNPMTKSRYIDRISILQGDELVATVYPSPFFSENPYVGVSAIDSAGPVEVRIHDTKGNDASKRKQRN
jgi:predicted secreted protein